MSNDKGSRPLPPPPIHETNQANDNHKSAKDVFAKKQDKFDDRSEGEHDQEPVYDEVKKDTVDDSYTIMSAGNNDIVPVTSPELNLPTVRLTGPPQSPDSLISQLDNNDRTEGDHDQEPVYDEVKKVDTVDDSYTIMSADNNDIIPITSPELKVSTLRLTGTPQSPDSLISQLDNNTVDDSYTIMSAGNNDIIPATSPELNLPTVRFTGTPPSPDSLISQLDNKDRSEAETDQDPVYDEIKKDTVDDSYTIMSADNNDIIPVTSPELNLPTVRLTGLPQSPDSLISQLDNSFKNEIRIVLIGKTGAGKSTTGNILLGKEAFSAAISPVSVTKECCRAESNIHSRKIVVIDTPGLFDTELSPEEIQKEIIRCVTMSVPGPHIFLILLQVGRLTTEEISTLNQLFDIFGKNMGRFCMIVFTRIEDLERGRSTIDKFIGDGGSLLSGYIEKCSGRYFALKNPPSKEEQFQVSAILFGKINEVILKNNNECFTNEIYENAKDRLNKSIKIACKAQNDSNSNKLIQIEKDCDRKINEIRSQKKQLSEQLEHQIDIKRQLKSEREALLKSDGVERNLDEELSKLELANEACNMRMSTLKREQAQSENQYEEIKTKKKHLLEMRAEAFKKELEAAASMAIQEQTQLMEPHFIKILQIQQEIQDFKTWKESGSHLSDKQMRKSFTNRERALNKQNEDMEKQLEKKDKHLKLMIRNSMKLEDEFKRTRLKLCILM